MRTRTRLPSPTCSTVVACGHAASRSRPSACASQRSGAFGVVRVLIAPETIRRSRARVIATYTSRRDSASSAASSPALSSLEERRRDELAPGDGDLEREPPVRRREQAGDARVRLAAGVGERDDVELEALRGVHGHDPHGVDLLLGKRRLGLLRGELGERADEREEAREVGPAQGLVVARDPHELAHVRVAPAPVGLREAGEVVVVLRDDPLEQVGDADLPRGLDEPVEALPERPHQPRVVLREPVRQPVLEPAEERRLRGPAQRVQARVGDADQRRGEHGEQRAVVVAAAYEPQVGAQVGDLLAPVVAAADRAVRLEARLPERRLVQVGVGARPQQHDHAGLRVPLVAQLGEARREHDRLVLAGIADRAGLVDHEQLERDAVLGRGRAAARHEALEAVVEDLPEDLVQHGDERIGRAEAVVEPHDRLGAVAPAAEHLDVGVAEAVDALALVADVHALGIRARDQLEDRVLQRVRVLELVDEEVPDARLHGRPGVRVADQQVARAQLEVGEVERGCGELARRVDAVEALHEPDDLRVQHARHVPARGALDTRELLRVGRRARRAGAAARSPRGRPARRARAPGRNAARRSARAAVLARLERRVVLRRPRSARSSSTARSPSRSDGGGAGGSRSSPLESRRSRSRSISWRSAAPPNAASRSSVAPPSESAASASACSSDSPRMISADDSSSTRNSGSSPSANACSRRIALAEAVDRRHLDALGPLGQIDARRAARGCARRARPPRDR